MPAWVGRAAAAAGAGGTRAPDLDADVARAELASMGRTIDTLTPEQEHYLSSYDIGT